MGVIEFSYMIQSKFRNTIPTKMENTANSNNISPSKKSKKRSPPADTPTLFQAIQDLRKSLGLTPLRNQLQWKQNLDNMLNDNLPKEVMEQLTCVILSRMYFKEKFKNESINTLLDRWLKDPGKRAVLLAPGNYSYISMEQNQINVIIFFIPKNA